MSWASNYKRSHTYNDLKHNGKSFIFEKQVNMYLDWSFENFKRKQRIHVYLNINWNIFKILFSKNFFMFTGKE